MEALRKFILLSIIVSLTASCSKDDDIDDNNNLITEQIEFKTYPGENNNVSFEAAAKKIIIDWGDGRVEEFMNNEGGKKFTHQYSDQNLQKISIRAEAVASFALTATGTCQEIKFGNCPSLKKVQCAGHALTSLNMNSCTALEFLDCSYNKLNSQALNALFESLHSSFPDAEKTIYIKQNPGEDDCNRLIASKKDWYFLLDLDPGGGVAICKYWNTKEEVEAAVMGCYAAAMNRDATWRFFDWGENRAEIATSNTTWYDPDWYSIQNGDISATNRFTHWGSIYSVINNCNIVLMHAKETLNVDASFSEELLKAYEAEVTCLRSLMYFYLVRTFGDVPLVLEAWVDDDQYYNVSKTSQAEILDTLVVNLKRVDRTQNGTNKGIPFNYGAHPVMNKGRFTVWGLKALLADIYLWKEDYENCIKECDRILSSGSYSLVPVSRQDVEIIVAPGVVATAHYPVESSADAFFASMYIRGNSVESILELQYFRDYENFFWSYFNPWSGSVAANTKYMQEKMFITSTIDRSWYDIRGEGVSYQQGIIWKWLGLDRNDINKQKRNGESFSNWIFYRLADVYLMKAEALTQLGRKTNNTAYLQEALSIMKLIRLRACATETTELISGGDNINADVLERFIMEERAREFSFEGKRWFDVLRNAKRDNYRGIDYLMELAVNAAQPEKVGDLQTNWRSDYNSHYLPIHESELKSNRVLVQNPFYSK